MDGRATGTAAGQRGYRQRADGAVDEATRTVRSIIEGQRTAFRAYLARIARAPDVAEMRRLARNVPAGLRRENIVEEDLASYYCVTAISEIARYDDQQLINCSLDTPAPSREAGVIDIVRHGLKASADWERTNGFSTQISVDGDEPIAPAWALGVTDATRPASYRARYERAIVKATGAVRAAIEAQRADLGNYLATITAAPDVAAMRLLANNVPTRLQRSNIVDRDQASYALASAIGEIAREDDSVLLARGSDASPPSREAGVIATAQIGREAMAYWISTGEFTPSITIDLRRPPAQLVV